MRIIGCDYHPSWQQVCWLETTTGETGELSLQHASGEFFDVQERRILVIHV